jgi:hypothetical protein
MPSRGGLAGDPSSTMAKHRYYGSLDSAVDIEGAEEDKEEGRTSSDTMRSQARGGEHPLSPHGRRKETVEMQPYADQSYIEDGDNDSSSHVSAQVGVKRAEAISTTWTTAGLAAAYLGCVDADPRKVTTSEG